MFYNIPDYVSWTEEALSAISINEKAKECFLAHENEINSDEDFRNKLEELVLKFSVNNDYSIHTIIPEVEKLAEVKGINRFTLDFIFVLHCAYYTKIKYRENGLSDSLFFDGLADVKYKNRECEEIHSVCGTFVAEWYEGFLRLGRFTLGRFQFEPFGLYKGDDKKLECGYVLKSGTRYVLIHIPSSGEPLTDEIRNKAYALANEYFREWVGNETVLLHCHSWLLNPDNEVIVPNSNISKFMKDFEIYRVDEEDKFEDSWRIFGRSTAKSLNEWDENTSLQKAYKNWLLNGNRTKCGSGFIVMNSGRNVTHIKDYFNK